MGIGVASFIFPNFHYEWLAKEFRINLPLEIDFRHEGRNAKKAKKLLEYDNDVIIPSVYDEFTEQRLLTMSFEEGTSIGKVRELQKQGLDTKNIAHLVSNVFNRLIF